jgi:(2Fe-2S) ferredoxin
MSQVAIAASHDACTSCTGVSSQLVEPLLGTAPHATAWLLLVHPGPWSAEAPDALLDSVVADELERRCAARHIRMVAVRRATTGASPACYVASSLPGRTWIERIPLGEHKDVLDLDLDAIAAGDAPGIGEPVAGPLYAVCTHGKRDACCAANGRPVHRALSHLAPGRAWESTHLGGHRFSANVLVLPEGLLYGRVDHDNVSGLVAAHTNGAIVPALWRGRSTLPQPAQAAEWFARRATGVVTLDGIVLDDIAPTDSTGHSWKVRLSVADRPLTAVVERVATGHARVTACTGKVADPWRWRLVELT